MARFYSMRGSFLTFFVLLTTYCTFSGAAVVADPEPVLIPQAGRSNSPAPLLGFVFRPPSDGPHPAVVMLHGCGGVYAKHGGLSARHKMWGEYFAEHGYMALMLDSFTTRGLKQICTVKFADRSVKESDRVGDAYAALKWLRAQSGVDGTRVVLLGWSHGAGVTLDAITQPPTEIPGFRAAVAFYPGCTSRSKKAAGFHPYAPLFVLIGEADDWTPAAPCVALAAAVAKRGEPMQIVTYPGAYHDFDNPGISTSRVRTDVPNGVNAGRGVTTGPSVGAREDAKLRVLKFFAENDKPG